MAVVNIYKKAVTANSAKMNSVKMKIALVCPYDIAYHGGVQNQVVQFAEIAKDLGHDVTIVAPNSGKVNYDGFVSAGKAIPVPVGLGTVSRMTFSFWNRHKLRKLIANGNFDVVHVHSPEVPILGPLAVKYTDTESTVLVTTSHSNISPNIVTWGYSSFGRLFRFDKLVGKVHVRVAVSKAAADRANHYIPGDYKIIPNGIDVERFSPNVEPVSKYIDDKINILFVGRMGDNERRKGLHYLVSAFNELHKKHSNTRLLIVGPGEPDYATRNLVNSVDNRDIVLVGPVPASDLPRYYTTAHIFASTPTDGESFSLVVAEAMAAGKPVVTSNIPGPRDVLMGFDPYSSEVAESRLLMTDAGILVRPRDVEATAQALESLVIDESMRREMGEKGREIVVKNFSWKAVAPIILAAYEEAIIAKEAATRATARNRPTPLTWATLK